MKALDLYKFIIDNTVEYHWNNEDDDVVIFVNYNILDDFSNMLGYEEFDEDGVDCVLKFGYVAIWMREICENYNIELMEIFNKED